VTIDAEQTVTAFAARLKDAIDLNSVRDDLAAVVQRALEPAHISIWTTEALETPARPDPLHRRFNPRTFNPTRPAPHLAGFSECDNVVILFVRVPLSLTGPRATTGR
jgi:hypothetical protein